jgi:hypothetical protein
MYFDQKHWYIVPVSTSSTMRAKVG